MRKYGLASIMFLAAMAFVAAASADERKYGPGVSGIDAFEGVEADRRVTVFDCDALCPRWGGAGGCQQRESNSDQLP